jgi:hypothetical protein
MSCVIEVEGNGTTVVSTDAEVVIEKPELEVEIEQGDLELVYEKKEYVVVGDNIYIPTSYEDAPQWLKDLVQIVTDVSIETNNVDLVNNMNQILSEFANQYVPLNEFTQNIVALNTEDQRINAYIETLNSNYNTGLSEANAQIINLQMTKASKDEAEAITIETISAQLDTPTSKLGATVGTIQQAIVDSNSAAATSYQAIMSTLETVDGQLVGQASATEVLNSYVGIEGGTPDGTGLLAKVEILEKQNDGVIETVSGEWDVMLNAQDPDTAQLVATAEPYVSWRAVDVGSSIDNRLAHIGDVYIKYATTSNGAKEYIASYKFIRTAVDNTSPYATDSEGFTWALIVDQGAQDAYEAALNAYDLADNKRRVFVDTPYTPYDVGDLWVDSTGTYSIVRHWTGSAWVVSDRQVTEFANTIYTPMITTLQTQVDKKIEYWFQTTDPKSVWTTSEERAAHNGDVWYNTSTKISQYYTSSTNSWNLISDKDALDAIAAAEAARQLADSKVEVRYGTSAERDATSNGWTADEKASNIGDLWVISDAGVDQYKQFRWTGSGWLDIRDKKIIANADAITQLQADLTSEAGLRVSGDTAVENTVKAYADSVGAGVETKWAYNSQIVIGAYTYSTGFGLATSATAGSGLTNGESEFWIKADKFKLMSADGSTKSSYVPFSVDTTTGGISFNGKVSFGNVTGANMSGSNLLYNSAPTIGIETKGWQTDYNTTGIASSGILAAGDPYRPAGAGAFYQYIPGTPSVNTVFDMRAVSAIPIIGGQFYEGSAYLNSYRCDSRIYVGWMDSAGAVITWSMGDIVTQTNTTNVLSTWGRSKFITQAPANAASCYYYIRGTTTGQENPHVFVSMCYFGKAAADQTIYSNWSDGISASVSSSEVVNSINSGQTTTINGGRLTTGSVTANQIAAGSVSADRLMAGISNSTVWTGGGLVSQNFDGNSYGDIGAPTQGFRLSSNAVGTLSDPNIYGAYIRGATINGGLIQGATLDTSTLKIAAIGYPGNYGRVVFIGLNNAVYGPGYNASGAEFNVRRVCDLYNGNSSVKVECNMRWRGNYGSVDLQYFSNTTDTWTTFASRSAQQYGYIDFAYFHFSEAFTTSLIPSTGYVQFRMVPTSGNDITLSDITITIANA